MSTGHHDEDIRSFPFHPDESVVRSSSRCRSRTSRGLLRLQHAGHLHALGDRAEGHRPDGARLPAPASVRSAGIVNPTWDASKQGVSIGGFGLERPHRRHRAIRAVVFAEGEWKGKQLVPAAWVETATSRQCRTAVLRPVIGSRVMGISSGGAVMASIAATARTGSSVWSPQFDAVIAIHERHAGHGVGDEPRLGELCRR